MKSVWQDVSEPERFGELKGSVKTDVLVIGGGMAGLLCARMLKDRGTDCVLIEADRILCGVTRNTTAKITFQHGLIYDKLTRTFGEDAARAYLQANNSAIAVYREMCRNIDCDFEEKSSYVYSLYSRRKAERETAALQRLGCPAQFVTELRLPFEVAGAVRVDGQAQFNPLKFGRSIVSGLRIYENTKALELSPHRVKTNRGYIDAEKIIVATHFPILNKHGAFFVKMYQDRSYVIALKDAQNVDGMYIDESGKGLSFRNYKDVLLLGGGSHRTGKKGGNWDALEKFAKKYYPDAKEVCRWATQDCITLDGIPYIGQYSANTPDLYVATGFNKWGMTSSMVSAQILSDLVLGEKNQYAKLFSPSRSILHPKLFSNAFETALNLITPTAPRCPHLGCALKYNTAEHTWDCPCHGSRFEKNGKLIEGPATDDKKL